MTRFYSFCHHLLAFLVKSIFRIEIIGGENEPENGAYLICANHLSLWDPVTLGACMKKRQVRYMAKSELFRIPILSGIIRALGAFPVDRSGGDVGAIKTTIELLKSGACVGIFPQGTRCRAVDPRTTDVKGGAGMCAFHAKCGVIPVAIVPRAWKMRPFRKTYVIIGEPMDYSALGVTSGDKESFRGASRRIFERICGYSDECSARFAQPSE